MEVAGKPPEKNEGEDEPPAFPLMLCTPVREFRCSDTAPLLPVDELGLHPRKEDAFVAVGTFKYLSLVGAG